MTVESVLFLPCNEGSGTVLTNTAGAGTKQVAAIGAPAWDSYNATTRPAVSLTVSTTAQDCINGTPFNLLGDEASPAPYQLMTFGLFRFNGDVTLFNLRFNGANTVHSIQRTGANFAFTSGSGGTTPYYQTAATTADRAFGVGVFTRGADVTTPGTPDKGNLRSVWAVIEYDPSDWSVVSTNSGDTVIAEPDNGNVGYMEQGGLAYANADFLVNENTGTIELYALQQSRVTSGVTPSAAASAAAMVSAVQDAVGAWSVGTKTVPASLLASGGGSSRRNRARRVGARR